MCYPYSDMSKHATEYGSILYIYILNCCSVYRDGGFEIKTYNNMPAPSPPPPTISL